MPTKKHTKPALIALSALITIGLALSACSPSGNAAETTAAANLYATITGNTYSASCTDTTDPGEASGWYPQDNEWFGTCTVNHTRYFVISNYNSTKTSTQIHLTVDNTGTPNPSTEMVSTWTNNSQQWIQTTSWKPFH